MRRAAAVYNFTGPQGFGIANMADALYAVKTLVFEEKKLTLAELKDALAHNYGKGRPAVEVQAITKQVVTALQKSGAQVGEADIAKICSVVAAYGAVSKEQQERYEAILDMIGEVPKFGNDIAEVDAFARDVAYTYTRPLENYRNPRGGQYQAGLYPVSQCAVRAQTGATATDAWPARCGGRGFAGSPQGTSTALRRRANSVSKLDHYIASNGTLFNMKFHPSALSGVRGLENFVALIPCIFRSEGQPYAV